MPGPEVSVMKLAYLATTSSAPATSLVAIEGAARHAVAATTPRRGCWQHQFLGQWSVRIGGGTDQVQRNVIGERVLGLPREARADKDVPFRELAKGR